MSIRFDEDIGKRDKEDEHNKKYKKNNKRKNQEEQNQVQENERKKSKQEMTSKIRDEVISFPSAIYLLVGMLMFQSCYPLHWQSFIWLTSKMGSVGAIGFAINWYFLMTCS